jgi:polar amino acid transport system permease protein
VGQHFIEAYYGKGVDNLSPAAINPAAAKAAAAGARGASPESERNKDFPEEEAK